jgi:hypothetical protein
LSQDEGVGDCPVILSRWHGRNVHPGHTDLFVGLNGIPKSVELLWDDGKYGYPRVSVTSAENPVRHGSRVAMDALNL